MSVIKQAIHLRFEESIKIEPELFSGVEKNAFFAVNALETAIEMNTELTVRRPPVVDDTSPIVEGSEWVGVTIVFNRQSFTQGGAVIKTEEVKETVEDELSNNGFDVSIDDIAIRTSR